MGSKINKDVFLKKLKKLRNLEGYDFSKFEYKGSNEYGIVKCDKHGEFKITPSNLYNQKSICPLCYKEKCSSRETLTNEEFISKIKNVFGDDLDYSLVEYSNNKKPVKIICKKHGVYETKPCNLSRGIKGCKKCEEESKKEKHEKYFNELKETLKDKPYDFSESVYKNASTKIKVRCLNVDKYGTEHGYFWAKPSNLLFGKGCPKCGGSHKKTTEEFVKDAISVHGDKYDYSKVDYKNQGEKVCIICHKHGEFWQTPNKHLSSKQGCPFCWESKLEKDMTNFLKKENINFERQKHFYWLGQQSLDFYLPDYNVGIECQGEQHFSNVGFFNSITLEKRIELDENKYEKCLEHGIKVLYFTNVKIPITFNKKHEYFTNKEELLNKILDKECA